MSRSRFFLIIFTIILSSLIYLTSCSKKQKTTNKLISRKHGISFHIPQFFKGPSRIKKWETLKWKNINNDQITISLQINWNRDLKFFPLTKGLDMYISNYRHKYLLSSFYLKEKPVKFPISKKINALSFYAQDKNMEIKGIYTIANNREYILQIKAPKELIISQNFKNAWKKIKTVKIYKLKDHNSYAREIIKKNQIINTTNIKEMLDYGQQLKDEKEDYIHKYPLAIKEIRRALEIMENLSEKPEYNRALRLMSILKDLQKTAFDKHYLSFKKHEKLRDWISAKKEAMIMYDLMSDDPEHPSIRFAKNAIRIVSKRIKYKGSSDV